jgi:hypothetical protein
MPITRVACPDDPRYIRDERMCLSVVSKDVEGHLRPAEDGEVEECQQRDCKTLKIVRLLVLDLTSNPRCEQQPPSVPDGTLDSRDLTSAFMNADGRQRGFHGGHFRWRAPGLLVSGQLSGVTNAGTHRRPFDPACQDCYAPGFMEGRLCGLIRRAPNESLIGCNVIGIYKLRLPDPSDTGGGGVINGVIEGLVVCACD